MKALLNSHKFWVAVTAAVSATGGIVAGMEIGRRKAQADFETRLAEEIEQTKEFYSAVRKTGDFETPEKAVQKLQPDVEVKIVDGEKGDKPFVKYNQTLVQAADAVLSYQGKEPIEELAKGEPEVQVEVAVNVFEESSKAANFNTEAENEWRLENPGLPYVITIEEFMAAEKEYEQVDLTYFRQDDMLVDDKDEEVPDSDGTVGNLNLTRFGQGSRDPRIVYVRNDEKELDFCIALDSGSYLEKIAGLSEPSGKHVGKFRDIHE